MSLTWDLTHSGRSFMWHKRIEAVPILYLVVRPSLHGHYLSVRLQLLLSFCGFVGMMIATDVYFLQFHSCVVYLRVLCVEPYCVKGL